jgi:outer membrane lipoprotein-sorting protein
MKRSVKVLTAALAMVFVSVSAAFCAADAAAILKGVDDVINAPKDQNVMLKIVLKDKTGKENLREMNMLQKGTDMRLARFLSPADQKGIGFLSLPDDVMYLYLPAFKKTRRIATSVKNSKFAGTDFSYEDMEPKRYTGKWDAKFVKEDADTQVIDITPRAGTSTDYSKITITVLKENNYPVKFEHSDKAGRIVKVLTRDKISKEGEYWASHYIKMEDIKSGHTTEMITEKITLDSGLTDETFTERYLSK